MSLQQTFSKYPAHIQVDAVQKLLRDEYLKSLYLTCKSLLGYEQMTRNTHNHLCETLQSDTKRKLIVMPRGTFKSSIGVVGYSIWLLMNNPNIRILIDSEVFTNSKNFLREIKGHLQSDKFISLFGNLKSDTNWNESEITVVNRTRTLKEASITCGGIETIKVGQHFDVIIGDDLNSGNNSLTTDGCQKVIRHYQMNTAILEPDGIYVVIGTRYSQLDLIGFILDNEVNPHGLI